MAELLKTEDFALKFRVLLAFKRIERREAFPLLYQYIKEEEKTHWRLAALWGAAASPHQKRCELLAEFLRDNDLLFLRGLVWALGSLGKSALPYLEDFASSQRRYKVREEVLAEALFLGAEKDFSRLEKAFPKNPALKCFWQSRLLPKEPLPKYGIYPYPDYLWDKAEKEGLSKKEFQQLHFWYRKPRHFTK